jgi:PAS domain S-box-containing protein
LGLVLAGVKFCLLHFQNTLAFSYIANGALAAVILAAALRASRRSFAYARMLWLCVGFAALLWSIYFGTSAYATVFGVFKSDLSARWPVVMVMAFPFAAAFTLPLLVNEDRQRLKIGWLQAVDIAQLGIIAFSAFLVFFYLPSLHLVSDAQRARYFVGLHLMRDSFLGLGYLYRGSRSRVRELRRLHFSIAGFLISYGVFLAVLSDAQSNWHWPRSLTGFLSDLPPLFLLATAATWMQSDKVPSLERKDRPRGIPWTQLAALVMPISVVALASRIPGQYLPAAWIIVFTSLGLYALRLVLMQRKENMTWGRMAATEEAFYKAFRSSPAAVSITRLSDGRYIDVNDRWLKLLKRKRENVIGRTSVEVGIFASVEAREDALGALREHPSVPGASHKFRVEGCVLETAVSAEMVELGGEALVVSSILDLTEFKSVKQQLQQAQKMELVGSLAGGVAHDFNNLLTVITGYSDLALAKDLDYGLAEDIRRIKEASAKAAALTRQLLAFSRRQVLQPRNISLNTAVGHIEKLLQRTIGENIALVARLEPQLGTVHADPVQMEQVLMNLAVNARDAMPEGGKLLFETKNLHLPSPYPENGFEIPAGRYVLLIVTDTGTGISPEHMDRIFEPFFTTKGGGTGTGLGLSTVYGIVKQSGGYIWAYSEQGRGTTFKVCLPRVDSPPDTIQGDGIGLEDLAGRGTVMVVDDDARVRELTARILSQYGYQVITADSGEQAEWRAAEFGHEIHLLLTDVIMAGASGRELAQQLKARRPAIKVLYMSGYPHLVRAGKPGAEFCESFLLKPFAPVDLARAAKKALNG